RTDATIFAHGEGRFGFAHEAVEDGNEVRVGHVTLEFWSTPGHTFDSLCVLVHVPRRAAKPAYVLTGGALLVGSMGRPGAGGESALPMALADQAFDAIQRLKLLPDETTMLPAHGEGTLCSAHVGPETVSTIGRERERNPYVLADSRAAFVSRALQGRGAEPPYFPHAREVNRRGPPALAVDDDPLTALSGPDVAQAVATGVPVVDVRVPKAYAAGHIRGALNVAVKGPLETWVGMFVPPTAAPVLVGSEEQVREAAFRLRRIGYDRVHGILEGGMEAWRAAGFPVRESMLVEPHDLQRRMAAWVEPVLVDVRSPPEYAALRIGEHVNVPVTVHERFGRLFDPSCPLLMICKSGYRSSIAVGLAEQQGFERVGSLDGGIKAWREAGYEIMEFASRVVEVPAGGEPDDGSVVPVR
ncbi:MAG: rhodanese-like domain-containing protein, partial [Planctomycetota bacterium]